MKPTGLHTGFNGGRDRMKSRIISWALFFNRGGMSPLTWKGESEIHVAVSHLHSCRWDQMKTHNNPDRAAVFWHLHQTQNPTSPEWSNNPYAEHRQAKKVLSSFPALLMAAKNNTKCSSFKQQYLGFWSNEIKCQGCNCIYETHTFPHCKSYISVEEGLGGFLVWFSSETQTFRPKTIYKTSQGRAINSLYVQDLKKAMEAFISYEECINCKLGISVWICFKKKHLSGSVFTEHSVQACCQG